MRLISYQHEGRPGYGIWTDRGIIGLSSRLPGYPDLRAVLAAGALPELSAFLDEREDLDLSEVELLPPIVEPKKILCVGINYHAHRIETGRDETPHPTYFTRWADTLVGHGGALIRPQASTRFDYEGELAVVIAKPARHVKEQDALQYVAGYACFNDASVRDWQRHTSQFTPGKNFPGTGGFGPALVTTEELPDPQALSIQTRLNGQVVQESHTERMIFGAARLIAYASTFTLLNPGDVIATGTPSGVGDKREPPLYLKAGDVVEVELSGVGVLRNLVKDE
ncbi:MAG: fumarylacetoacetate hydrolase family protein [Deltaproteobacteria bacterium]|nr:fumarylacetoacetate hydrolase family protein [Deltaproteobacteria bacterium]